MKLGPTKRMVLVAFAVLVVDQISKALILRNLPVGIGEKEVIEGFFRLVHWTNRGAAWSLFNEFASSNFWLGSFAIIALVALFLTRRHFDIHMIGGQIALGLISGGIVGNLIDRVLHHYVIDFLYFYLPRRGGEELGFPAFNVADAAICTGVGLLFLMSWQRAEPANNRQEAPAHGK